MWVLDVPITGRELLNANERLHWAVRADRTRELRKAGWAQARRMHVPRLERAVITGVVHPPDNRRRDPHNWYPSIKAFIDGIVDAKVLTDDDSAHLLRVDLEMGDKRRPLSLSVVIRAIDGANDGV